MSTCRLRAVRLQVSLVVVSYCTNAIPRIRFLVRARRRGWSLLFARSMLSVDTRGGAIALFVVALLLLGARNEHLCIALRLPRKLYLACKSPLLCGSAACSIVCRHLGRVAESGRTKRPTHGSHMDGFQHRLLPGFAGLRLVSPVHARFTLLYYVHFT